MKAVVAAFNQEKALVGAFSVITNLRMELFQALTATALDFWRVLKYSAIEACEGGCRVDSVAFRANTHQQVLQALVSK